MQRELLADGKRLAPTEATAEKGNGDVVAVSLGSLVQRELSAQLTEGLFKFVNYNPSTTHGGPPSLTQGRL